MGASVNLLGVTGDDILGQFLIDVMKKEHIDTSLMQKIPDVSTDLVGLFVNDVKQVGILGAGGAIKVFDSQHVRSVKSAIEEFDAILLGLEPSHEVADSLLAIANGFEIPVFLNPAPVQSVSESLLSQATYLLPNRIEAQSIARGLGISPVDLNEIAKSLALVYGLRLVCITNGQDGCIYSDGNTVHAVSSPEVKVVDSTGAGDAFCATFTLSVVEGISFHDAVTRASVAGSIACETKGGLPSMPQKTHVDQRLKTFQAQ